MKLARHALLLALALGSVLTGSAAAQVNTETLRLGDPPEGLYGDLKADLAVKRGNTELLQLGSSGRTYYRAGLHTPLLFVRGAVGSENDEIFEENGFVHARWTAMWLPRLGSELFGQIQYNAFIDLKFRALIGAGPRVLVVQEDWIELYFGTGYMLEHEVLDIPPTEPHPRRTLHHRSTNYASMKIALAEALLLTNVAYFQPRWDRFQDFRALDELELQLDVNEYVAVVNTFSFRYDSDAPTTVRDYDLDLKVGVRVTSDPAP